MTNIFESYLLPSSYQDFHASDLFLFSFTRQAIWLCLFIFPSHLEMLRSFALSSFHQRYLRLNLPLKSGGP